MTDILVPNLPTMPYIIFGKAVVLHENSPEHEKSGESMLLTCQVLPFERFDFFGERLNYI